MKKILYISYDGLLEPLGRSQVFAYLNKLASDFPFVLLTFEKRHDWSNLPKRLAMQEAVRLAGIRWIALTYHQKPPLASTLYDLVRAFAASSFLCLHHSITIVHARSYVPAVLGLFLKKCFGTKFIFDMRGFWPDEKVDAGQWRRSSHIYNIAKRYERRFLQDADVIVSLTHAGVKFIVDRSEHSINSNVFSVIPTCVDLQAFKPVRMPSLSADRSFVLGYVGTSRRWYDFEPVGRLFLQLLDKRPDSRLLVINKGEHDFIKSSLSSNHVPMDNVELVESSEKDVAQYMNRMSASAIFLKPAFSTTAAAPTRFAELLGCGVPCIVNRSLGDMSSILEHEGVGVVIEDVDDHSLALGADKIVSMAHRTSTEMNCVRVAHRYFSLQDGADKYASHYRRLLTM